MKITKKQLLKIIRENLREFRSLDDRSIAVGSARGGSLNIAPIKSGLKNLKTANPRQFKKLSNAAKKFMPLATAGATVMTVGAVADAMAMYFKENEPEVQFTVKDKPIDFADPQWLNKLNLANKPKTKRHPRESRSLEFFIFSVTQQEKGVRQGAKIDYIYVGGKSVAERYRKLWCEGGFRLARQLGKDGKINLIKYLIRAGGIAAKERFKKAVKMQPAQYKVAVHSGRFHAGQNTGYRRIDIEQMALLLQTIFCGPEFDYDTISIHDYRSDIDACATPERKISRDHIIPGTGPLAGQERRYSTVHFTSDVLYMNKIPSTSSYPCKNFFFLQNL